MATSIAAQLQKVRAFAQADFEPQKKPFTRPSVLFSSKEAADIDLDSIFDIALSGLEILIREDERFRNYKNDLFSHKSKEMDRELKSAEENSTIDTSISSYLRLLSGYFHLPSSLKTLEYLIRRYKIHVYNIDELILCALPYHDTHAFVRIVQLVEMGNSIWKFLEGVKVSGATLPRKTIVQQCIRDMGVLEILCSYASPSKKYRPSRQVIRFCTALVVEVLGSVTAVENDVVKRILPFVSSGLQFNAEGNSDHKAGSLMVVGLLASKATLSPKLVNSLIRSISEAARADANDSTDLQWFQLSFMALINLVQLQSVDVLPKKALEVLMEIRDIGGVLSGLSKEFNIDKFLAVILESLIEQSCFPSEGYHLALISILESVPVKSFVDRVACKTLSSCMKLLQKAGNLASTQTEWAKKVLMTLNKKYPSELCGAFSKFLETTRIQSKKESTTFEALCKALDGTLDASDSKIWLSLHHPKPEVRRATLSGLKNYSSLKTAISDSQGLVNIQDAILRQVLDDDLTVVHAALSVEELSVVLSLPDLLNTLSRVLERCVGILMSSSSEQYTLACDVAVLCIDNAISNFRGQFECSKRIAAMIFPLLLVLPKTKKLNLKALELAKQLDWPLYQDIAGPTPMDQKTRIVDMSSVNLQTIDFLAKNLSQHLDEYIPWLLHDCGSSELSKTLSYFVIMQTLQAHVNGGASLAAFLETVVPVLKSEWNVLDSMNDVSLEEFNKGVLHWDCRMFLDRLSSYNLQELNANILACIFWRILEAFNLQMNVDALPDQNDKWARKIEDLFLFFAASQMKHCFMEHIYYLVKQCKTGSVRFLISLFSGEGVPVKVQIEGLHCFAFLCIQPDDTLLFEILAEFPSLLVPLASDNQDIKIAAMSCIDALFALRPRFDLTSKKNGKNANWSYFLDEILGLMVQNKRLILSDRKFLSSLLTSLLSSSCNSLAVPRDIEKRFDQSEKTKILAFILGYALKLPAYGKLAILSLLKDIGSAIVHIEEVENLLSVLLKRRSQYYIELDKSCHKFSDTEVEITCLLLQCCAMSSTSLEGLAFKEHLLKALQMDGILSEDPAVVKPCITVLQNLSRQLYSRLEAEMQDLLFEEIVFLFRNGNAAIQNATKDVLLRLHVSCSSIERMLDSALEHGITSSSSDRKKIKKQTEFQKSGLHQRIIKRGENFLSFVSCILDILLLKKDIENRAFLLGTLFKLVGKLFFDKWVHDILSQCEDWIQASSGVSETSTSTISYTQQAALLVLEDICASLVNNHPLKDEVVNEIDVKLLVDCARSTENGVTRNHVFSLLTSITKIVPEKVLEHVLEILAVVGKSAVIQVDSHSQHVFEDLLSVIVPCWLSKMGNTDKLLEIFIKVLPGVAEHRRLSIVLYLLRTLGEHSSLAPLLILLFRTLISRKEPSCFGDSSDASDSFSCYVQREWEYAFALDVSRQFSHLIWLPSVVSLLDKIGKGSPCQKMYMELLFAMHFILQKLEDPEFVFKIESEEHLSSIQRTLEELMERVVYLVQLADSKRKQASVPSGLRKLLKELAHAVLRNITSNMVPATLFEGIIKLLGHSEMTVRKKALSHLGETLKSHDSLKDKHKQKNHLSLKSDILVDEKASRSFQRMCQEIVHIIDEPMDGSNGSLTLSAVSALEVLANRFPSQHSIFVMCLASVCKNISSDDVAISSCCLRTSGALVEILGPRSLPELPSIMKNVIKRSHKMSSNVDSVTSSSQGSLVMMSILVALEAVLGNLGGFLNPYLGDIIELLVLHPQYVSEVDVKLKLKADAVRRLFTTKIPVRLALPPLLRMYSSVLQSGDLSLAVYFEVLANLVGNMDRQSVSGYHGKIFDLCLVALDIRGQRPASVQNINVVEKSVINAMVSLTMKLTETMFKPLFVRTIEWVDSNAEETIDGESVNVDRVISFYGLVNKLAENHRSLFVPYFKYLLEGCVRYLTCIEDVKSSGFSRKKKKAKIVEATNSRKEDTDLLSLRKWHLKALILSSLYKCFLYDTGSLKFLDSVNFQMLLKPVVSQIAAEPPASIEEHSEVPSVKEVDDLLVVCIGQMAVTAGSDLLWKPLNHEVLMQTRSDKVRSRLLALRIIRYLLENLKEEYLIFLPESIPFLGELLEDMELPVKSLAQDIFKEMETMSGENLREYL